MIDFTHDTGIFFSTIDNLMDKFSEEKSKEQVLNECVEARLKSVLEVQSKYFDEELDRLEQSLDWDLYDAKNIRNISSLLKRLYKVIACDRISIISNLISICEVQ